MREHDRLMQENHKYRSSVSESQSLRKQVEKDKKLKKRLRQWIKEENPDVPDDIRAMIGWV